MQTRWLWRAGTPDPLALCAALALCLLLVALVGGCPPGGGTGGVMPQPDVQIELQNQTPFVVDANFFISATASHPIVLFVRENIYTGYSEAPIPTLRPGQAVMFARRCDNAASLGVRRPVATNPLTLTGSESADEFFLLRGAQYNCGSKIRFVYYSEGDVFRVRVETPP